MTIGLANSSHWHLGQAVRIKLSELASRTWTHQDTFTSTFIRADSPATALIAGGTEWSADFNGSNLTAGWDWYQDADSRICLLEKVPPRSNIVLIDEKGYDVPHDESDREVMMFLREAMFWQSDVLNAISSGLDDQSATSLPVGHLKYKN
jgi:hypothetical protein